MFQNRPYGDGGSTFNHDRELMFITRMVDRQLTWREVLVLILFLMDRAEVTTQVRCLEESMTSFGSGGFLPSDLAARWVTFAKGRSLSIIIVRRRSVMI
jgi:hypothetical protein